MKPAEFVKAFLPHALETERKTGINHVAILAQAALESGWGAHAPGNMFFGVKDTDGLNGNEQLLRTVEYSTNPNLKYQHLISITPVTLHGKQYYKYVIKAWFRKYESPEACFTDHANFFFKNKRYAKALLVKEDPYKFLYEVAKAGYATGVDYYAHLEMLVKRITTIKAIL